MKKPYTQLLEQTNQEMAGYGEGSPGLMGAFMKLHHAGSKEGALAAKHKELIAIGISIHAKCEGCIVSHMDSALKAGATQQEIIEAIDVAVYMGGGPCVVYGSKAFAALKEFGTAEEDQ